ncbi:MAG: hypothetical protein CBARDMAM_2678 [uncultured Caballeronia sp.]|nr:MAG: hypothetical protein CBARDMAM_2678 [uncultured Caballeronia sp.]
MCRQWLFSAEIRSPFSGLLRQHADLIVKVCYELVWILRPYASGEYMQEHGRAHATLLSF